MLLIADYAKPFAAFERVFVDLCQVVSLNFRDGGVGESSSAVETRVDAGVVPCLVFADVLKLLGGAMPDESGGGQAVCLGQVSQAAVWSMV
jgi:hypothetical protein